jgi:mycothiol synthase
VTHTAEPSGDHLAVRGSLSREEAGAVLRLAGAATEADGVAPLSEQVVLHVEHGGSPRAVNLLLLADGTLTGYAHLDPVADQGGPSGELVVGPAYRGQGRGRALADELTKAAGGHPFGLWAHGDLRAARRLAAAAGFDRVRALWQMRRPLTGPLPDPVLPDGVTVRTFVAGQDEQPWLDLNRLAFATHPEQGAWTRADLDQREREPWFDPDGFFLAERAGKLAGFHWTKIHQHEPDQQDGPMGEVYVVGVDPAERGTGLGRALTLMGLHYLRSRGLREVLLYVDEANTPAVRLYESLGFTRFSTDVMYRRAGHGG